MYSFPNPPYSSPNANTQCSFHSLKLIEFALCLISKLVKLRTLHPLRGRITFCRQYLENAGLLCACLLQNKGGGKQISTWNHSVGGYGTHGNGSQHCLKSRRKTENKVKIFSSTGLTDLAHQGYNYLSCLTHKSCLLNSFGKAQRLPGHLWTLLACFRSLWKIIGNPQKSLEHYRKFQF